MKKVLFVFMVAVCFQTPIFAASIKVTGEVARGTNNSFIATVTLNDVTTTELAGMSEKQYFESRIFVIIESYDSLKVPFGTAVDDAIAIFKTLIRHDVDGVNHDIVAQIEIRSSKTLDIFKDSSGDIFIGACIRRIEGGSVSTSCDEDIDNQKVEFLNIVVDDAPQNFKAVARHLQTTLNWKVSPNPVFTNFQGTKYNNRTATAVYAVLVKTGEGVGSLPALEFLGGPRDEDTAQTCILNENELDGQPCVDCANNNYIDIDELKKSADVKNGNIKISELLSTDTEVSFVGLEEDHRYIGFVTYAPDSLKRSTCFSAIPYKGLSWTELNGGSEAKTGIPCFVATAAYGTDMAEEIEDLRWFRDEYLMPYAYGRLAVKAYYKYGPGWADYVAESEQRKALVRVGLWPIVKSISFWRNWNGGEGREVAKKKK